VYRLVIAAFTSVVALVFVTGASASAGDLDTTFGAGGVAQTDVGQFDNATDLIVQPDGKILAGGTVDWNGTRNIVLARYTESGAPDAAFGSGGVVVPDRYHQVGPHLVLQQDGKIVIATRGETSGGSVFLYRFNPDGSPDAGFGPGGTATMSAPVGVGISNVAGAHIVAGGKILVVLRTSLVSGKEVVSLARFNPDGTADGSFGQGGFVQADVGYSWLPLTSVLQSNGRLIVGGFASLPGRFFTDAFVARFTVDGALDASFERDGIAFVQQPSNGTEFQALAVAPDGSIVAGGRDWGTIYNQNRWLLARFTGAGSLDSAFGTGGLVLYDPGSGDDVVLDLAVTSAGIYTTGLSESLAVALPLALFTSQGALDPSFGTGGLAGGPNVFSRGAWRLDVQADGKVVVLGNVQSFAPTFNQNLFLARYIGARLDGVPPTLQLPTVFGVDATNPRSGPADYASSVSATDNVDPNPTVSCSPPSGNLFPIGDTTVSCTATDAAGNSSQGSFTVHVKDSSEQVADLIALVDGYQLGKLGSSLQDKLVTVQRFLAAGKNQQSEENLAAFISQVKAQRGKGLTEDRADALVTAAQRIKNVIPG
jgi:uncharacterized delta-60 repeat protein